jgi:hypothetical protein
MKGTNDGIRVLRALAAKRSKVFHRMLYGNFAEASKAVAELGYYSGEVLKVVVE